MVLKIRQNDVWANLDPNETAVIKLTTNEALSTHDPVVINTDGTISKVGPVSTEITPDTTGSEETFTTKFSNDLEFRGARIAYVPDGDYYIICYVANVSGDADTEFLRVRAATVNSTGTITYGPEYEVHSENTTTSASTGEGCDEFTLVYDPDIKNSANQDYDAVLVFYNGDNSKSYTKYVWSTNGTNLSFGNDIEVLDYDIKSLAIAYNKGIEKFMLTYVTTSSPHKLEVRLGTPTTNLGGGKVDFSSATEIYSDSSNPTEGVNIVADKTSGFIVMHNESTGSGTKRSLYGIDVDGTTLDVGSATYLSDETDDEVNSWVNLCVFHEEKGKFVYIFHGKKLGTVATEEPDNLTAVLTLSGNSISYRAQYTVYEPGSFPDGSLQDYASLVYDPYLKEVYTHWSHTSSNNLIINKISIDSSGEIPSSSVGTKTTYFTGDVAAYTLLEAVGGASGTRSGMTRFAAVGKTHHLCVFKNNSASYDPGSAKAVKVQNTATNLTATNFLGFSESAYAANTIARINIAGYVDSNRSGLTAGQTYYVQTDGTLSTTADTPLVKAGLALNSTTLLVRN